MSIGPKAVPSAVLPLIVKTLVPEVVVPLNPNISILPLVASSPLVPVTPFKAAVMLNSPAPKLAVVLFAKVRAVVPSRTVIVA